MVNHRASSTLLLILLSAAVFFVRTAALMLGPLLVELATVINVSWTITTPLIGPVSDTHGRRLVGLTGLMLMGISMLGAVLAWHFSTPLMLCLRPVRNLQHERVDRL